MHVSNIKVWHSPGTTEILENGYIASFWKRKLILNFSFLVAAKKFELSAADVVFQQKAEIQFFYMKFPNF